MKSEEKRRRFHENLLKILYPSPPSPPDQEKKDEEAVSNLSEGLKIDQIPDDPEERSSSSSSDWGDECEPRKLTRAQRKRFRKGKLKEAASRRRKIIGPLFPTAADDGDAKNVDDLDNGPQDVRRNAKEPGEPPSGMKPNKLKHRRTAKRLANEKSNSSSVEDRDKAQDCCNDTNEA